VLKVLRTPSSNECRRSGIKVGCHWRAAGRQDVLANKLVAVSNEWMTPEVKVYS